MTEIYNVLNQAPTDDFWFVPIIFGVFGGVIFLILLIKLIKMIVTEKILIGRLLLNIFAMGFVVLWISLIVWGINGDKQTYETYREALESGTCLIESGTPEGLEIYRNREGGEDDYEITFYLNGKYFDSYLTYGEGNFSKNDLRLIQSSEIFEVKYIVDEYEDNIILSLSVGEKTT